MCFRKQKINEKKTEEKISIRKIKRIGKRNLRRKEKKRGGVKTIEVKKSI